MKQVAVIAYSLKTAVLYADRIRSFFGERATAKPYALEKGIPEPIQADAALLSAHSIYGYAEEYLRGCQYILVAELTLYQDSLEQLRMLPPGTRAMLVNSTMEMAVETIRLIHNAGIKHIELTPVYPGLAAIPPLSLAITPGETDLVPENVPRVINLKDRVLSAHTITALAAQLGLTELLHDPGLREYFNRLVFREAGADSLIGQMKEQQEKLRLIMDTFDGGILSLTNCGIISFLNPAAEKLLGKSSLAVVGQPLVSFLPGLRNYSFRSPGEPLKDQILRLNGQLVDVSVYPIQASAGSECVVMLKTVEDLEQNHERLRRQLRAGGFHARYCFSDIKTRNPLMLQRINSAKRMALSSSSIVICGESGTGKELFAQAIHNASQRREGPFIAINCASIPEALLESELFGYSEGAFTGAKKGGKRGYFELANGGTLFLDEIGEMDLLLQSRILRVLQEKEVIRVGGDRMISIDVRIISATNRNLLEMVRQGRFRGDLYYRLNVLSLEIPPLRHRSEDIPVLLEEFQSELGTKTVLSAGAVDFLKTCPWYGNVRELRNFAERACYLESPVISAEEARSLIDWEPSHTGEAPHNPFYDWFFYQPPEIQAEYRHILLILQENEKVGIHLGRLELSKRLSGRGIPASEQQVRTALQTLRRFGLVQLWPGRRGTELTDAGRATLPHLVNNSDIE